MTTAQIRKRITVSGFALSQIGIYIVYYNKQLGDKEPIHLDLNPLQATIQLERIGSIDKFDANPLRIWWESEKGTPVNGSWEYFWPTFVLSQSEAIDIVIRHEAEKELNKDLNIMNLDNALKALG